MFEILNKYLDLLILAFAAVVAYIRLDSRSKQNTRDIERIETQQIRQSAEISTKLDVIMEDIKKLYREK